MADNTTNSAALPSRKVAYINCPLKASIKFKNGGHVCKDASGYLVPAADTASYVYMGRFFDPDTDTTGKSDGDVTGKVTPPGNDRYQEFDATSPLTSWIGKLGLFVDDHTVALAATTTNDIAAGRILEVLKTGTSGRVLVDTDDRSEQPAAA